jgi:hypothetical protein
MFIFILIIIGLWLIFSSSSGSSSTSRNQNNYVQTTSSNTNFINIYGEFETGSYLEDVNVYVKGPVYSYPLSQGFFWGYGAGTLSIQNSSGQLSINLVKSTDNRMVPTSFTINNEKFSVIEKNGQFFSHKSYRDISLARTINYILDEQARLNMDEKSQKTTFEFLIGLLVFNMMLKRKIIFRHGKEAIEVGETTNLEVEYEKIWSIAVDLVNKYSHDYLLERTNNNIEQLLTILELPSNERDLNVIKKQYKVLAKKYHPDVYLKSDQKFKEINSAYEELCTYLNAS